MEVTQNTLERHALVPLPFVPHGLVHTKRINEKGKIMRHKKIQSNPSLPIYNSMTEIKTRERSATRAVCRALLCAPRGEQQRAGAAELLPREPSLRELFQ